MLWIITGGGELAEDGTKSMHQSNRNETSDHEA